VVEFPIVVDIQNATGHHGPEKPALADPAQGRWIWARQSSDALSSLNRSAVLRWQWCCRMFLPL